jgi:uncharacterized OB-fold protein
MGAAGVGIVTPEFSGETPVISDDDVFTAFPGVLVDRDNIGHYRGILGGKLLINRCAACGRWIYPHRPLCPQCLSWDVHPAEVSGHGKVFLFTLIHQLREPGGRLREPLVAAAVELAEQSGLRYLARIVNCPGERIIPDMAVRLTWIEGENSVRMPAFEPVTTREL